MNSYIDGDYVVTEYDSGAVTRELRFIVQAEAKPTLSPREFLKRFTPTEYATIKAATSANSVVDYYWQQLILASFVDLADPDTIGGVQALESAGLIGAGRAAEILE